MRRNNNIYCMHANDVCFTPKIQLPGINIDDNIDEWLDGDEDFSSFSRLVKRFQKRTSICPISETVYIILNTTQSLKGKNN
jgi:hypothetical protein